MFRRKKADSAPRKRRFRPGLAFGMTVVLALGGLTGWMSLNASTVHVRYADVTLPDLPDAFDGTTVLFASDLDLCGLRTAEDVGRLFDRLQALQPDLLLLGGDYAGTSLFMRLNSGETEVGSEIRRAVFAELAGFTAPLGKFAVSGDMDGSPEALALAMTAGNISLIDGKMEILTVDGQQIGLAGISGNPSALAAQISSDACVIALMHSPERVVDVRITEAGDGGPWADLLLAGHTHGGQVNLFGRSALSLSEVEKRYLAGWYTDSAAPLLVTTGVGCEALNLRLGTQAEVWLITLRCPAP